MKRVLVLNGYSSSNSGDGLLVDESLELIREALGTDVEITLIASYPDSFEYLGIPVICSKPTFRGVSKTYLRLLHSKYRDFDLVVGVGGGYLRGGSVTELMKMALVMGPQLIQAARSSTRTVYLPQSIGPARLGSRPILKKLLAQVDRVWVRDDRSLQEFSSAQVKRAPDLAILGMKRRSPPFALESSIVLTVRSHRGSVPAAVYSLRARLGQIDSFVQSQVGSNDDTAAVASLLPTQVLDAKQFLSVPSKARVVVAMRLHAALMAIAAGHYVVHLSYERKGFGAFSDLGLDDYVFNVHSFDVSHVAELVHDLANNAERREAYDYAIHRSTLSSQYSRDAVVRSLREPATP